MRVQDLWDAETFWALSCVLLRRYQDDLPGAPAHDGDGDDWQRWATIVEESEDRFSSGEERHPDSLTDDDKRWVLSMTSDLSDVDAVHAVAWGIGVVLGHTFTPVWRDELRSGSGGLRVTLRAGDLYPVCDTPWEQDGLRYSSKPASLSPPLPDELPHIRMHRSHNDSITVDLRFDDALEAVFTRLTHVAALIPNEAWDEIDPSLDAGIAFPVGPRDPEEQRRRLVALVAAALEDRVRIAVLPELSRTDADIDVLHEQIFDHPLPHLLVTGSHHAVVDGHPENVVVAVLAGHPARLEHAKTTPFSVDLKRGPLMKEGIRRRQTLELTVFQGGRFRLALPICKELLDGRMTDALDRLGANVILTAAMSEKMAPFVGAARARVAASQALTVVVNGPRTDSKGAPIRPNIVLGRPAEGEEVSCFASTHEAPQKLLVRLAPGQ
jgi:predicted amidohydrolase